MTHTPVSGKTLIIVAAIGITIDTVSALMFTDAVPAGIEPLAVRTYLAERQGVTEVHDWHIWSMSTTETALLHLFSGNTAMLQRDRLIYHQLSGSYYPHSALQFLRHILFTKTRHFGDTTDRNRSIAAT